MSSDNEYKKGFSNCLRLMNKMKGFNINKKDIYGKTLLGKACWNGDLDAVNALLSMDGIDVNRAKKNGATPLGSVLSWPCGCCEDTVK